jgi:hypothetical protein
MVRVVAAAGLQKHAVRLALCLSQYIKLPPCGVLILLNQCTFSLVWTIANRKPQGIRH